MDDGTQGIEARRTNARRAKILLAVSIPFLVLGVIVLFSTRGGISPALICGVVLSLIAGGLRDRTAGEDPQTGGSLGSDPAGERMYLPRMLTWPTAGSRTDLFPYRGATYSLGLVQRNERSSYVIQDQSGNVVGEYHYATDGWLNAWKTFRDLEPATAVPNEDP